jgi:hypothetical protein
VPISQSSNTEPKTRLGSLKDPKRLVVVIAAATLVIAAATLVVNFFAWRLPVPGTAQSWPTAAPTTTHPPGPSNGTTPSGLDLPQGYVGTWLGTITQAQSGAIPNSASLKVVLTGGKVGDPIGTATMGPSIGCPNPPDADITLEAVSSDSISVRFASGATNCFVSLGSTAVHMVNSQQEWDLFLMIGEWRGRLSKTG